MSLDTVAGRQLRDSCQVARPDRADELAFSMAALFCIPAENRTLANLDGAGIFIDRSRLDRLRPEIANLLLSDEGLQLWLQFAASPSGYLSVFVDAIMSETFPTYPTGPLARALSVLVGSGRDMTNDVPRSEAPNEVHLPLCHLCCHVAPEWLPSLLEFGADANQVSSRGVPLVASAMAAEADRLHSQGYDLLVPHDSLYRLGTMLRAHGAHLTQPSRAGSSPAMLLTLNGYCGAAEVLLALGGATCNAVDGGLQGNTLMHHLASAAQGKPYSFAAFFLFTLALRYGGDPDQSNFAGVTPASLLPDGLFQYLRLSQKMITQARERARYTVANPKPKTAEEKNGLLPMVSAVLATEAKRLCDVGHDPLLPHESLLQLAASLKRRGVNLTQRHADGTPPVLWLTLRGYCGAAEALLATHPCCNEPQYEGNTLMHFLAATTRYPADAIYADYMLNTALRYGGNPAQPNATGNTPLAMLTQERIRFVRAGFSFISQTRRKAAASVANRKNRTPRAETLDEAPVLAHPMRHSAAAT
ncbi:hypothetical protein [Pandoraea sp. NPDC087047]|uniref:hypothetical protein n=1 Tax=Pandoraea sp. NPDC087047 TaxID=3364390 RepID=UPI00381CFD78